MGTLSYAEGKRFNDRLGARRGWREFYEDPAVADMIAHARFNQAGAVCEFGCGTGRLAAQPLAEVSPADATYLALDVSGARATPRVFIRAA